MKTPAKILFLFFTLHLSAHVNAFMVRGKVVDAHTGEGLPMVTIQNLSDMLGTLSDEKGEFEYALTGPVTLRFSYLGYTSQEIIIQNNSDTFVSVLLLEEAVHMNEAVVRAKSSIKAASPLSASKITSKEMRLMPGFAGEADLVQSFMSMPGVKKAGDANGGMLVRGGSADQNLVLLDGVPVYQAGHIISFYSPFQSEMIQEANLYKGYSPVGLGGRISSVMTLESINPSDSLQSEIGLGMLMAKGFIQSPIVPGKLHVQAGMRRSLPDLVWPLAGQSFPAKFYDGRVVLSYTVNPHHTLKVLAYQSSDVLDANGKTVSRYKETEKELIPDMSIQTKTKESHVSLQHNYEGKFHVRSQVYVSRFDSRNSMSWPDNSLSIGSGIADIGISTHVKRKWNGHTLETGAGWVHHNIEAMGVSTQGAFSQIVGNKAAENFHVGEGQVFVADEYRLGTRWTVSGGVRLAVWEENAKLKFLPEPKLSLSYAANKDLTWQFAVLRNTQRIQKVSSSSVALPTDAWYPVFLNHTPQSAWQSDLCASWSPGSWLFNAAAYYKRLTGLSEFKEGALPFTEPSLQTELTNGKGVAYGADFSAQFSQGGFQIQMAYSLAWSKRQFDGINGGKMYFDRFDRRHDFNVQILSKLNKHWHASAAFYVASGARYTPRIAQFIMPGVGGGSPLFIPVYGERNSGKLSTSHRLDVAVTYTKQWNKAEAQFQFGAYNCYNQLQSFRLETIEREGKLILREVGLFGMMPSVSCTIKF